MLDGSEWPSGARGSSLSDILERGGVPQRYSLSPTACKGTLARMRKCGRKIPKPFEEALAQVAGE